MSKLDALAEDDEVRVTTSTGEEITGTVAYVESTISDGDPQTYPEVEVRLVIDNDAADLLGTPSNTVDLRASRPQQSWRGPEVVYLAEWTEDGGEYDGVEVERVERIG